MAPMDRRYRAVDRDNPAASADSDRSRSPKRSATDHLDTQLGQDLRELYQSIVEEPIPAHLLELVETLAKGTDAPESDDPSQSKSDGHS
jgi:hypothetical protein